tara:strand:+ start:171 stop:845 length:675 start_codon:yes stop_codon:yes gene_type:complete
MISLQLNNITFLKNALEKVWNKEKDYIKYVFGLRLFQYASGKIFDYSTFNYTNILSKDIDARTKMIKRYRSTDGDKGRSPLSRQFQRLLLGYNGIPINLTPFKCQLSSELANENKSLKKVKLVNDHIMGVTTVADYIIKTFKNDFLNLKDESQWTNLENKFIYECIAKMCDEWLKENLWLWSQCRITFNEHKVDKLSRGMDFSFDDKRALKHYTEADIRICEYV